MAITAIVLAAGLSRRMGQVNKLLLPFGSGCILDAVIQQILASKPAETIVVTGFEAELLAPQLPPGVRTIHNPHFENGLITSIHAGVRAASPDAEGFMFCLADMPLIRAEAYTALQHFFEKQVKNQPHCIVRPYFQGRPGNPVIFAAAYQNEILALDYPDGCKPLLALHAAEVQSLEMPDDAVLLDADTPEAYEALLLAAQK